MGVTPSENFWTLWRPSQGVTPVTFCSKNILFRNFWGVTGITTCDGRHTLITKINQSNEKYYCMTGVTPFEVFQWSMNGWIEWTWDWRLAELFRLQVIFFYSFENMDNLPLQVQTMSFHFLISLLGAEKLSFESVSNELGHTVYCKRILFFII